MPWLGAGRAAELGRRLGTRRRRHPASDPRRLSRACVLSGRLCVRGERIVFASGYTPFPPDESWQALHCALRAPDLLTRLADQWPGMGAMPRERPTEAASRA